MCIYIYIFIDSASPVDCICRLLYTFTFLYIFPEFASAFHRGKNSWFPIYVPFSQPITLSRYFGATVSIFFSLLSISLAKHFHKMVPLEQAYFDFPTIEGMTGLYTNQPPTNLVLFPIWSTPKESRFSLGITDICNSLEPLPRWCPIFR